MAKTVKAKKITRFANKTTGLLNFADLKKPQFKLLYWVMFFILFLVSLICLLPTLWVAVSGFKEVSEMYAIPPTLLPSSWNFGKVGEVWNKVNVVKYFIQFSHSDYRMLGLRYYRKWTCRVCFVQIKTGWFKGY